MTHDRQRITNGNPMETIACLSRAVRVGRHVFIGGTAPVDAEGRTVGVGDVGAQTRRCFEIIGEALAQAGASFADVTRTRVILTDIERWREAIDVRKEFCGESRPVDTIMAVTRFVNPEWLVEIEVDAVISDRDG